MKKNQNEILKLKSTIIEMEENSLDGFTRLSWEKEESGSVKKDQ